MKAPSRGRFSELIEALRMQQGLSQLQLDQKIGRKPSFIRNLEAGINRPPDLETCRQIAAALGVSARTIWDGARDERLRTLDEDLYRAYVLKERIDPLPGEAEAEEANRERSEEEDFLLELLRWLDEDVPDPDGEPLAGLVGDALLTVFTEQGGGAGGGGTDARQTPTALAVDCVRALRRFADYAPTRQAAVLRVLVAAVDAAEPSAPPERRGRPKRG